MDGMLHSTARYPVPDWTRSTHWPIITPSNARNFIVSQGVGIGRLRVYPTKILTLRPDLDHASVGIGVYRNGTALWLHATSLTPARVPEYGALFCYYQKYKFGSITFLIWQEKLPLNAVWLP